MNLRTWETFALSLTYHLCIAVVSLRTWKLKSIHMPILVMNA